MAPGLGKVSFQPIHPLLTIANVILFPKLIREHRIPPPIAVSTHMMAPVEHINCFFILCLGFIKMPCNVSSIVPMPSGKEIRYHSDQAIHL